MTFAWNRREALSILLTGVASRPVRAANLESFLEKNGTAVLMDFASGRVLARGSEEAPALPGSTLKPVVLAALLRTGKLKRGESWLCRGKLRIANRSFDCSHPPLDTPMQADMALAYSCNGFAAHFALRFTPAELASELSRAGFSNVRRAVGPDALRLQALGEYGILVTAEDLARAYRRLAQQAPEAILSGLEAAVRFGTAQRAAVAGLAVAGKTGSVRGPNGGLAWFAGFAPARRPDVVIAVAMRGRSGGADAAPVAGRIFEAWKAGRL